MALYNYIDTAAKLNEVKELLLSNSINAIDTETTGLDPHTAKVRLLQIGIAVDSEVIILDLFKLTDNASVQTIQEILEKPEVLRILQGGKFDIQMLWGSGFYPNTDKLFDTMIAAQLIDGGNLSIEHNLKALCQRFLAINLSKEERLSDWSLPELTPSQLEYAAKDVVPLLQLYPILKQQLIELNLIPTAIREFKCIPATAQMEYTGIYLNTVQWNALKPIYQKIKEDSEEQFIAALDNKNVTKQLDLFGGATYSLNLSSSAQVIKELRRLKVRDPLDENKLINSADQKVLRLLDLEKYPFLTPLLEYKTAQKRITSFLNTFEGMINPVTHRIHSNFNQIGAETGRFSSSGPNQQQIPRSSDFRACFQPEPGHYFVIADYSQIELRIMAEWSQDPLMIEEYCKGVDADLHTLTAALMKSMSVEEFKKLDKAAQKLARQQAKAVNFGLMYCMGADKLKNYAKSTYGVDLTLAQAEEFRYKYLQAYAGVTALHSVLKKSQYMKDTRSFGGRLIKWNSPPGITGLANAPVQSTSCDITKIALGSLYPRMRRSAPSGRIVTVIHDEIILEFPDSFDKEEAKDLLSSEMVRAAEIFIKSIPVYADAGIAMSWAEK